MRGLFLWIVLLLILCVHIGTDYRLALRIKSIQILYRFYIFTVFCIIFYLLHNIRLFFANLGIFQFRNNLTDQTFTGVHIIVFLFREVG